MLEAARHYYKKILYISNIYDLTNFRNSLNAIIDETLYKDL